MGILETRKDQIFPTLTAHQVDRARRFASGPEQRFAPGEAVFSGLVANVRRPKKSSPNSTSPFLLSPSVEVGGAVRRARYRSIGPECISAGSTIFYGKNLCDTPALSASSAGYEVYIVAEASSSGSYESHGTAIQRMLQAGCIPITGEGYLAELQRDWSRETTAEKVRNIYSEAGRAYGQTVKLENHLLSLK